MLLAYGKALKSPHHRRRPFDKLRTAAQGTDSASATPPQGGSD